MKTVQVFVGWHEDIENFGDYHLKGLEAYRI